MQKLDCRAPLRALAMTKPTPFGTPIPEGPHAVSVSMPAWQDVVDYEEGNERAKAHLKSGYPRFVYHPLVRELGSHAHELAGKPGETSIIFPSRRVAEKCVAYLARAGIPARVHPLASHGLHAVFFPDEAASRAKEFWQHAGLVPSSRLATAFFEGRDVRDTGAKALLKQRIAGLSGENERDIFLYPSGMGAIFTAYEAACARAPGAKTIQLGFSYVDTLKIQERFGAGVHYVNYAGAEDLPAVEAILAREKIAAVMCEFPMNPLLASVELEALSALLRPRGIPLIVDDTVGTFANVEPGEFADLIATSLTKFFSGVGNVMAGCLRVSRKSPLRDELLAAVAAEYEEDIFFVGDAETLEENSRDFLPRMQRINENAAALTEALAAHPKIARVYYPRFITPDAYRRYSKPGAGYGGLFSLTLKDESRAPAFYDAVAVAKGPSFGTNYTLACPYTLLAHYHELDFAARAGVSAHLVRISTGLETTLTDVFTAALEKV